MSTCQNQGSYINPHVQGGCSYSPNMHAICILCRKTCTHDVSWNIIRVFQCAHLNLSTKLLKVLWMHTVTTLCYMALCPKMAICQQPRRRRKMHPPWWCHQATVLGWYFGGGGYTTTLHGPTTLSPPGDVPSSSRRTFSTPVVLWHLYRLY